MEKLPKQQVISIITDCVVKYKENFDRYQLLFILNFTKKDPPCWNTLKK